MIFLSAWNGDAIPCSTLPNMFSYRPYPLIFRYFTTEVLSTDPNLQPLAVGVHVFIFCHRPVKGFDVSIQPLDHVFVDLLYECVGRAFLFLQHIVKVFHNLAQFVMLLFVSVYSRVAYSFLKFFLFAKWNSV